MISPQLKFEFSFLNFSFTGDARPVRALTAGIFLKSEQKASDIRESPYALRSYGFFAHTSLNAKCLYVPAYKYAARTAGWQHFHHKEKKRPYSFSSVKSLKAPGLISPLRLCPP